MNTGTPPPPALRANLAAASLVILALALSPFAFKVSINNSIEKWVPSEEATAKKYEAFRESFGSDEFILIAYGGGPLFDTAPLDLQWRVALELEQIPGVVKVLGIPTVYRDLFGGEDPEALRDEVLGTPFYQGVTINTAGDVAGILLETSADTGPSGRRALVDAVRTAMAPLRQAFPEVHMVGPPSLNVLLDTTSATESQRTFPVALGASLLVLVLFLRSVRLMLVGALCAGLSVLFTLEAAGLAGRDLNMVTAILPAVLFVLALANVVHLLRRYQDSGGPDEDTALVVAKALASVSRPCRLAAVTTAAGFASLLCASMAPVRELGALGAVGMLAAAVVNLSVGPALIRCFRVPPPARPSKLNAWAEKLVSPALKHPKTCIALFALLMVSGGVTAFGLQVNADPLRFFPANAQPVQSHQFVADRFSGFYTLEMVIDTPGGWMHPESWRILADLKEKIEANPAVARVISPTDLLLQMNHWDQGFTQEAYKLPETAAEGTRLWDEAEHNDPSFFMHLVAPDGNRVRLSAIIRVMDSKRFLGVISQAESLLQRLPAPMTGYCTGIVRQLVEAQLALVDSQLRSFAVAFLGVFLCILVGLRSWKATLLSIAPNIAPALSALFLMGLAGIALDAATIMVASVALGIAVDDTVHVLSAYQRKRVTLPTARALRETALETGPALIITTVMACIGFVALARSAFVPIRLFGVLSAAALAVALAADLWLTPALLMVSDGSGPADDA